MSLQAIQPGGDLIQDASFLSLDAAYTSLSGDLQKYLNDHGANWKLVSIPGMTSSAGWYQKSNAEAFAAVKGDTLAIAIRGSADPDLAQDLWSGRFDPMGHYDNLLPFLKAVLTAADKDTSIHKILITGHSLGGQAAELFATTTTNKKAQNSTGQTGPRLDLSGNTTSDGSANLTNTVVAPADLLRFNPSDVSIITFGSAGLPGPHAPDLSHLQARVLNIYDHEDPIYGLFNTSNPEQAHVGTQLPLYNVDLSLDSARLIVNSATLLLSSATTTGEAASLSAGTAIIEELRKLLTAHQGRYKANVDALSQSTLSNSADSKTIFVFDAGTSPSPTTVDINDAKLGIPKGPHFLVELGGADNLIGAPGDSILAWSGTHIITGWGATPNRYEIITGNDTITNFLYNKGEFILHSNVPVIGRYITDPYVRTVLTFTQSDQQKGTLTLTGVDLTSVVSQMPWLHWEGTSATG